jgi:hypothetical protein
MAMRMFTKRRAWPTLLACAACTLAPVRARAEAGAAQKAAAESLFDDALKAMKSGRYADACPKLEESERIDPGIGTLLYLGECYEKTGRSASAWATFREAASSAQAKGEAERARIAAGRADRLQAGLSKLTISVAPESAQLSGLRVTRDNVSVEGSLFGVAIPVDPGKYHVVANADGYDAFQTDLEVGANADAKSLQIPALKPAPKTAVAAAGTPDAAAGALGSGVNGAALGVAPNGGASPSTNDTGPAYVKHDRTRTAAYVTGALGIVGLGVGSYFGVRAISKNNNAETYCPSGNRCDAQQGVDLTEQARHAAVASNIALVIGAALVVTGVVLYLSSEPTRSARLEVHPMLSRDVAGFGFGGSFR